jgi:cell division inhibitor SulA
MAQQLNHALFNGDIWQGKHWQNVQGDSTETGYTQLDEQLVAQGWESGSLNEVLYSQHGAGELQLLMPALAKLSQQKRWIIWVAPPFMPYAPALAQQGVDTSRVIVMTPAQLKDQLWTLEQALKSGSCSAVLGWIDQASSTQIRRLKAAAQQGNCLGFIFRPMAEQEQASAASNRLTVEPSRHADKFDVEVVKRRGGWPLPAQSLPRAQFSAEANWPN